MDQGELNRALRLIFEGIDILRKSASTKRLFTIDGRLVGDIGEIIAERELDITLDARSRKDHDAKTRDGRDVQIKATFKDSLTFTREPNLYLGLKLFEDGRHEIVFNGPGRVLTKAFAHRSDIGAKQLSFSIKRLKELSESVEAHDRVPVRLSTG